MPSLFADTDPLICEALGISKRTNLNHRNLRLEPLSDEAALRLVNDLHDRLAANFPGRIRSPSERLWKCRRETGIADLNKSQEKMLEKAVVILAAEGHMPGWFNQCPAATGVADPRADNHRAIDLVHLSDTTARLIELKWASNTPAYALFELLEYGLAYLFAWIRTREFCLENRSLMHVPTVRLEVAGPRTFYADGTRPDLFAAMSRALETFALAKTNGAVSMSLHALAFPAEFESVPFANGRDVKARCRTDPLSDEGRRVREAFTRLAPADTVTAPTPAPTRFLPGVPGDDIERMLDAAPGNEIASGKFDTPESSAALAVNTFGFFLHRPADLPELPGCAHAGWPARSLAIEANVRFPWSGGRHPWLDGLVVTGTALIGIESKRFEPFRKRAPAQFSDAYSRPVWGYHMRGHERVRDALRASPRLYTSLDAAQLVKHAFALRSEVHRRNAHRGLSPILLYVYAEPDFWPRQGRPVDAEAKARHRREIAHFEACVADDEVAFVACSYRTLLELRRSCPDTALRTHAQAVLARFSP